MAEQLTGTVVAEKYRLDTLLRRGSIGDFYRGRHVFMDKPVTLKVLPANLAIDEQIRSDFNAEARAAAALSDPHILGITDFGSDRDGAAYIVYEGFDAEPLSKQITSGGQFSVARATAIVRQAAEGLNTAHSNGFVHGELTPESVLVANTPIDSTVKIFDLQPVESFGAPRSNDVSPLSVAYLAPETFSGLRSADGRSDLYSLGIIFYQMLTGEVPFKGETPTDVMLKHAEEQPAELSKFRKDVPPRVEAFLRKALAKDPDQRSQTAEEFISHLDAAAAGTAPTGRFWKTAAAVVLGIGMLAAALIYGTSSKQTMPPTQLQPDLNGHPVQPIGPATGAEEQNLISMPGSLPGSMSNSDIVASPPSTLPGGDNYNPWAAGGSPPAGAPMPNYVPPGGQYYNVDPNGGSVFMPNDQGVVLVPVPANTNVQAKPSPTPKTSAANANTQSSPPVNAAPKPTPGEKPAAAPANTKQPSSPAKQPARTKKNPEKPEPSSNE